MLPRNHPDRIQITFDDRRLVANAGLLLPATLARHLGLPELVRQRLDLGDAPGRANTSDKMMTLVASALAGGDCIDDADVLRTGGTACTLGGTVKAPSTLGTFLRSFRWGHVRQLDRVSRELLARAWQAGAGPGDGPLTIDLDSTICETYGLAKEGARHHGYTGKRGYHPLLAIAAGTGDVLMSRLREGRANTARGAAHFLRETVGRVRYAGANGRLTLRADSGFYTHGVVSVCRKMDVRFSITIRQHKSLHNLIEAIPEDAWTPIPYWMDGAADVAETTCTPFQAEADAAPVRLIVRRVKPTPGSRLALFAKYARSLPSTDRARRDRKHAIRDLKTARLQRRHLLLQPTPGSASGERDRVLLPADGFAPVQSSNCSHSAAGCALTPFGIADSRPSGPQLLDTCSFLSNPGRSISSLSLGSAVSVPIAGIVVRVGSERRLRPSQKRRHLLLQQLLDQPLDLASHPILQLLPLRP